LKQALVIILIGRIFQVLLSILILKISTVYLSTEEMGIYFLFVSILSYFGLTLIGPVGHFVIRKVNEWKNEKTLKTNLFKYNIYVIAISLASVPVLIGIEKIFGNFGGISLRTQLVLIPIGIYVTTLNTTFTPILNLLDRRIAFVVFTNMTLIFNLMFSVFLVSKLGKYGINWFIGQLLAQLLLLLISGVYLYRKINDERTSIKKIDINKKSFEKVYNFSVPLVFSSLFIWVSNESFRFIIEKNINVSYVGIIGVGFAIATKIATSVETLVHQIYYPIYYKNICSEKIEDREKAWNTLLQQALPLYIGVTFYIICMSPFFLRVLTSKEYFGAMYFVVAGAMFNFFRMLNNLMSLITHAEYRTKLLLIPNSIAALCTVLLVMFVSKHEHYYYAVPISLALCSLIGALLLFVFVNKIISIKIEFNKIFLMISLNGLYLLGWCFFEYANSLIYSLVAISLGGTYFLISQGLIYKIYNFKRELK